VAACDRSRLDTQSTPSSLVYDHVVYLSTEVDRNSHAIGVCLPIADRHFKSDFISVCMCVLNARGHLVNAEDVVTCLQSFLSDRDVDPFKRIHILQTVEQVSVVDNILNHYLEFF